jgi:hypothetical protein
VGGPWPGNGMMGRLSRPAGHHGLRSRPTECVRRNSPATPHGAAISMVLVGTTEATIVAVRPAKTPEYMENFAGYTCPPASIHKPKVGGSIPPAATRLRSPRVSRAAKEACPGVAASAAKPGLPVSRGELRPGRPRNGRSVLLRLPLDQPVTAGQSLHRLDRGLA